jgi:hypothetical protein
MDRLDELLDAAGPLLARVDEMLGTAGAPGEHPVWAELRRVRLLPGDATRAVAALRPAALGDAGSELRAEARTCAAVADGLPPPEGWTGDASEAYDNARRLMADELGGGHDSLDERFEATADLAEALSDWMRQTRAELAVALARVLGSGEAVTLTGGGGSTPPPTAEILASADIGAHLLRTVADNYEFAADLLHGSATLASTVAM